MIKSKEANLSQRIISYLIDEAIIFIPMIIFIFSIQTKLVNAGVFKYTELAPLVFMLYNAVPFPMLLALIIDTISRGFSINSPELFIGFTPILMKIIISSLFEGSNLQGTPGKVLTKISITNEKGGKVSFLKALLRNIIKYISIIILPLIILLGIHNKITKTIVIHNDNFCFKK